MSAAPTPEKEPFRVADVPRSIFETAFLQIRDYSTCFIVDNQPAGSGTFVRIDGVAGILTARHVWDNVVDLAKKEANIGILISDQRHVFTIPFETLVPAVRLKRRSDDFGPDLEFVRIPQVNLGTIEARKSFFNFEVKSQERFATASNDLGVLVIAGFPANRIRRMPNPVSGKNSVIFYNLGIVAGLDRVVRRGRFDYLEMETGADDRPKDYRGVSGAGVWKVIVSKKAGAGVAEAFVEDFVLAGVAFFQSELSEGRRFIRAHGPVSIYSTLSSLLKRRKR